MTNQQTTEIKHALSDINEAIGQIQDQYRHLVENENLSFAAFAYEVGRDNTVVIDKLIEAQIHLENLIDDEG